MTTRFRFLLCWLLVCTALTAHTQATPSATIVSHEVDVTTADLRFYLNDASGKPFQNHGRLQHTLDSLGWDLVFAMNGGMFDTNLRPIGLYIENGVTLKKINTVKQGYGNFHLQPNGVFYITTQNTAAVVTTDNFKSSKDVKYATQSGPMLVIDAKIHPEFKQGSANLNIRNGVGILPNGHVLFAMSTEMINFYDFAQWFKARGCNNALYLDGFVSKMYLPAGGVQQRSGAFGVIMAEVKRKNNVV